MTTVRDSPVLFGDVDFAISSGFGYMDLYGVSPSDPFVALIPDIEWKAVVRFTRKRISICTSIWATIGRVFVCLHKHVSDH